MIQHVLIDLAGVLYSGGQALPGARDALARLQAAGCSCRFLTNTTRSTCAEVIAQLQKMGFAIPEEAVFSAPLATRARLLADGLRPMLLVHPGLLPEFDGIPQDAPNAVVVGDAGEALNYARLNSAFRLLMQGAPLLAMGRNRYFQDVDGLSLDQGPFVCALEEAAGIEAEVLGKPAKAFFDSVLRDLQARPDEAIMIGDDLVADIQGAQEAGIPAILVRTGKYRPADGEDPHIRPAQIADDFARAVDWLLAQRESADV
ncbi:TIGR01458 family HAD-type hydrolase [Thermithiobacillus plumbiphilus]|uniref:Phospholysine phosphohistidine inorganic pyrophosphate phosphatase n=1 Tax=Thermithiobacillus plumbiphilus TaxID=1729899 RepID=A0ABU9D7K1_9PROT